MKGQNPKLIENFFTINTSLKLYILAIERKKKCNRLKGETWEIKIKRKIREKQNRKKERMKNKTDSNLTVWVIA